MQLKLFKKSTIILGLITLFTIACIVALLVFKEQIGDQFMLVLIIYLLISFVITSVYASYDVKAAQRIVQKMVTEHKVALARIKNSKMLRSVKDANWRSYNLWALELDLINDKMEHFDVLMIEKFCVFQEQIPTGYIFVTYDPKKPDAILAVPNVLIQSDISFQPLAVNYERKIKPTYLNCYYRNGLIIQTYKQSMKEAKEQKKAKEEAQKDENHKEEEK